jgi:hypothetical protein
MTGIGALVGGGFSTIPGSTPFGGQITPLDSESRSLNGARPVVSPEFGGAAPFGGQSGLVDGAAGVSCPYNGEVEIAVRIATPAAAFFKLRIRGTPLEKTQTSQLRSCSSDQLRPQRQAAHRHGFVSADATA